MTIKVKVQTQNINTTSALKCIKKNKEINYKIINLEQRTIHFICCDWSICVTKMRSGTGFISPTRIAIIAIHTNTIRVELRHFSWITMNCSSYANRPRSVIQFCKAINIIVRFISLDPFAIYILPIASLFGIGKMSTMLWRGQPSSINLQSVNNARPTVKCKTFSFRQTTARIQ